MPVEYFDGIFVLCVRKKNPFGIQFFTKCLQLMLKDEVQSEKKKILKHGHLTLPSVRIGYVRFATTYF